MVDDCDMKLLITESARIAELRDAAHGRIVLGRGPAEQEIPSLEELRREYQGSQPFFRGKPDDTAAIIYSSGSTGRPKGIVISHRNLADGARIVASYLGTKATDRIAAVLSLNFDYGLNQLWQTLFRRIVALPARFDFSPRPVSAARHTADYGLTSDAGHHQSYVRSAVSGSRR